MLRPNGRDRLFFSGRVHSQDCIPQYPCLPGVTVYTVDCSYCTGLDNMSNANAAMDRILVTDPTIAAAVNSSTAVEIIGIDNTWATFESDPTGSYLEYDSGTDAGSGGGCVDTRCIMQN